MYLGLQLIQRYGAVGGGPAHGGLQVILQGAAAEQAGVQVE